MRICFVFFVIIDEWIVWSCQCLTIPTPTSQHLCPAGDIRSIYWKQAKQWEIPCRCRVQGTAQNAAEKRRVDLDSVQCAKEKGNLQQRKRQIAMDAGLQLHFDVEVEF